MTYETLKREVAALGFEDTTENEDFLLFALRRAQRVISIDFPLEGTYRGYQKIPEPIYRYETPPAEIPVEAGAAISFKYLAPLTLIREDGKGSHTVVLPEGESTYRALIADRDCVLRFEGEGRAWDLCVYRDAGIRSTSAIPVFSSYESYALKTLVPDFLTVSETARDASQSPIHGARIEGDLLLLPREFTGEFTVRYSRKPEPIDKEDGRVDIAPEAEPLLPLLSGAYLWLDDEPEKAQYYMLLYREGVNRLQSVRRRNLASGYDDVIHWA